VSAKSKIEFWKFGSIFIIAATGCLLFGCEIKSAGQVSPTVNTNAAASDSQRLNLAASNSAAGNTNLSSTTNKTSNAADDRQNNAANTELNSRANVKISDAPRTNQAKKSLPNPRFDFAAAQNLILSKTLTWTFGGKFQIGWSIYKPLICHTIGVEIEASDNDFAEGLSRWQKENGLFPSGILDRATLVVFVAGWQANRLKVRGYASPNELMTTPTADFYDVSRPDELRQIQRDIYAAYKKLVAAAIADKSLNLANNGRSELDSSETYLKIVSAFRSRDYQNKLRKKSPHSGRAGLAVNSPHFTGRALDIYVGGEPVMTKDANRAIQIQTPVYLWLIKNAEKFGFKPYFYEPWHWEYAPD